MSEDQKWNFDHENEDANEERRTAIEAEADHRARGVEAVSNADAKIAEAKAESEARIAEAAADARAREAEAAYGWIGAAQRLVRTCIIGGALFASFYYTPEFWPSVTRTLTEVLRTAFPR